MKNAVIFAIALVCVACTPMASPESNGASSSSTTSEAPLDPVQTGARYELQYHTDVDWGADTGWFTPSGRTSSFGEWDAALVRISDGEVMVESIKEIMPELNEQWNKSLIVYAHTPDGTTVFRDALIQTDAISRLIYKFDESAGRFVRLPLTLAFHSVLSPDQAHVAQYAEDTVVISDVVSGKNVAIASVEEGERLSVQEGWEFDLTWIDDRTVSYAVYGQDEQVMEHRMLVIGDGL